MANTKISQLPSWSGTAADLRWFVMNNSGETETFKFSGYTSPFRKGDTTNSIVSNNIATNKVAGPSDFVQGTSNQIQTTGGYSTILGGESNTITSASLGYNTMIGCYQGTVSGNYGASSFASNAPQVKGYFATILGSVNSLCLDGRTSTITGGENNTLQNGSWSGIFAGSNNKIYRDFSAVIGGRFNEITTSGENNALLAGYDNKITGGTNVVGIGLTGRTSFIPSNNTTYVENIHVFRTPSTAVQSVSSGSTFTCNLNNGGKAQFYLTANTTIDITNVRDGQSFIIKTQTDGNYTITWTATGYTFVFEGGTKDPGNTTTDLFVFEVFGSVIYGNRRHNYT